MAGQRGRLRADAFHQAAVAADRIDVIVEHVRSRAGCSGWPATCRAIAMPTLVAIPCPSGPVVVSTPTPQ